MRTTLLIPSVLFVALLSMASSKTGIYMVVVLYKSWNDQTLLQTDTTLSVYIYSWVHQYQCIYVHV